MIKMNSKTKWITSENKFLHEGLPRNSSNGIQGINYTV